MAVKGQYCESWSRTSNDENFQSSYLHRLDLSIITLHLNDKVVTLNHNILHVKTKFLFWRICCVSVQSSSISAVYPLTQKLFETIYLITQSHFPFHFHKNQPSPSPSPLPPPPLPKMVTCALCKTA